MAKVHKQQQQQKRPSGAAAPTIALPGGGKAPSAPPPPQRVRSFVPSAWMVVKTATTAACGPPLPEEDGGAPRRLPYPADRKVFANVCYSPAVPAPAAWRAPASPSSPPPSSSSSIPPSVEAALDRWTRDDDSSAEALRFPISCGPLRRGSDRRGDPCLVADVVLAPAVCRAAERCRPLRAFLIQLALGWLSQKYSLVLDEAGFRLPRMAYKTAVGETGIAEQRLVLDSRDLVSEIGSGGGGGGGGGGGEGGGEDAAAAATTAAAANGQGGARTAATPTAPAPSSAEEEAPAAARAAEAAAAAAAKAPAAPAPAASSPPSSSLPYALSFEGRPATAAVVRADFSEPITDPAGVRVQVSGPAGRVRVVLLPQAGEAATGAPPTTTTADVLLPFSVAAQQASARLALDGRSLTVRLPWLPVEQAVREMVGEGGRGGKGGGGTAATAAAAEEVVSVAAVVQELE